MPKVVSYKSTHTAWVGNGLNFRKTLHQAKNAYTEAHARPKIPIDKIVLVPRSLRRKTLFYRKLEKMHVMIEEESFTLRFSEPKKLSLINQFIYLFIFLMPTSYNLYRTSPPCFSSRSHLFVHHSASLRWPVRVIPHRSTESHLHQACRYSQDGCLINLPHTLFVMHCSTQGMTTAYSV